MIQTPCTTGNSKTPSKAYALPATCYISTRSLQVRQSSSLSAKMGNLSSCQVYVDSELSCLIFVLFCFVTKTYLDPANANSFLIRVLLPL